MKTDILQQAARALREETAASDEAARFTRARVMGSLHRGKRRRRWHVTLLVPIAAVLAGGTAWGAWGHGFRWRAISTVVGLETESPSVPAPAPKIATRVSKRMLSPRVSLAPSVPASVSPASVGVAPAFRATSVEPRVKPFKSDLGPSGIQRSDPSSSVPDPELELYRVAHHAHFAGGNASAALGAWDAYLRKSTRRRFALEANYNRAICLVRLGRKAEARRALEPFASGAHGSYRRQESQALLDALGE
jgi:hypothetical protein